MSCACCLRRNREFFRLVNNGQAAGRIIVIEAANQKIRFVDILNFIQLVNDAGQPGIKVDLTDGRGFLKFPANFRPKAKNDVNKLLTASRFRARDFGPLPNVEKRIVELLERKEIEQEPLPCRGRGRCKSLKLVDLVGIAYIGY